MFLCNALLFNALAVSYLPLILRLHTTWCGQKSTDTTDSLTTPCIPVSVRKDEKWWNERIHILEVGNAFQRKEVHSRSVENAFQRREKDFRSI